MYHILVFYFHILFLQILHSACGFVQDDKVCFVQDDKVCSVQDDKVGSVLDD